MPPRKPTLPPAGETIIPCAMEDVMHQSMMPYSEYVILERALPRVEDGLKPVQRRILYTMYELGLNPDKPHRKCARIVGDCLGKYHPHGDSSVYDAMVRLAQDFNIRYTLVAGQGNFGSIDGDGAAAMRYTEAKLTKLSMEMVRDLEKETVDFYPNFDETLMQPEVLPSRFPNLLVNGSNGIAVGMATNIPPHNLGEVIDASVHMLSNPDCTTEDLMQYVKGPDFPTGGMILGKRGIYEAYNTGRGRIITRARSEIEEMQGNRQRIVVTEIPYMVNKSRLVERMAELVKDKRLDGISDIRDESDRDGMRIVIELKRDINANVVLNTLYKHTQMQETFGAIMLALVNGEPRVLSLREMLFHYLEHQQDVILRRTRYDLDKALARAHILEGLLIALDHIDAVIRLIRASQTDTEAKAGLMEAFGLSEKQAVAILDMRMRRLTGLEREKLQLECEALAQQIAYFQQVLESPEMVRGIVRDELLDIKARFADPRRTEITALDGDIDMLDLIQEEDMVLTMTQWGYVKRLSKSTYRAQRRGGRGVTGATTREEDFVEQMCVTSTHDPLMFFTDRGRAYQLYCYEIPEAGRTARGTAIVNLLQLDAGERVKAMLPIPEEKLSGHYLVMVTRKGIIKRTELGDFANIRRNGIIALIIREDDDLIAVRMTDGNGEIFIGTRNGQCIRFRESDVRCMGRAATGVKAIDLADGDEVVDAAVLEEGARVLSITEYGYGKRTEPEEYRVQSRGGKGIKAMQITEKTGLLACHLLVHDEEDLMLMTDDGIIIRTPVSDISIQGRNTQGVRLMRVAEGTQVVCVARAEAEEEFPEEELHEEELHGDDIGGSPADGSLASSSKAMNQAVQAFADELLTEE